MVTNPSSETPITLLILDDDALTGQTIRSIAEFAGLDVRFTSSPQEFFEWVNDWQPTFVALDLIMPEMDGVEVMQRLAQQGCTANLIITSGVGSRVLDAAVRSAREHGLNILGSLAKPFSPAELRSLLSQVGKPVSQPERSSNATTDFQDADTLGPSPNELSAGIEQQQLRLVYQPKIHCQTGALEGLEALVRWQHPRLGLLTPDRFISIAESHGLIDALTEAVAIQALQWLAQFKQNGWHSECDGNPLVLPADTTLSINISARSLSNFEMFDRIANHCRAEALDPGLVIFELTESSAMEDPISSLDTLTRLRVQGFQLSIDDFGTGFSSMLQLVRLPFSEIKIDKSFVMTANESAESRAVIKSIVDLGHSLGLEATAEGIENDAALEFLRSIGCNRAQGYYIARPLDNDALGSWFANHHQNTEQRRLASLHSLNLLDTPGDERFDRITLMAKRFFNVPIALVSLIDADRQWFISRSGLDQQETPRSESFCTHTIEGSRVMVIEDATVDQRVAHLNAVSGPDAIRFYAGYPLRAPDGNRVGTLCVIDTQPRHFSGSDIDLITHLGKMVEQELAIEQAVATDTLTGALNRPTFERQAGAVLNVCQRLSLSSTLVLVCFDSLRSINQSSGREAGDSSLIQLYQILRDSFSDTDLIGRYSGDDFIILVNDHSPGYVDDCLFRMATTIRDINLEAAQTSPIQISWGVTDNTQSGHDLQTMIVAADKHWIESDTTLWTKPT